jgi:hypothetical protein
MKPFRLTRPEPKESDVLSAVLTALSLHPRVAWHARMNSGAGKIVRKGGMSQFMRWGFPGCPDVLGQLRGPHGTLLAVECKRPSGEVTPEQTAFLECVRANGGVAIVARSVDDVIKALA